MALADLPRATFYDRLHRNHKPDKYAELKECIKQEFEASFETYGYRRIWMKTLKKGFSASPNTINRLMSEIGIGSTIYSRHTSHYSSYKGRVGTVNDNLLKQTFNATKPFTVLHTDITQVKLTDGTWGYISAVTDEASREILTYIVSETTNKKQLAMTLENLASKLPEGVTPILHSDQGWQYQLRYYQTKLHELNIIPSMSRKGNCHDNAPIESFFNLLKRERINRQPIRNLEDLQVTVDQYVTWFNTERISMKHGGLTPQEYRQRTAV